MRDGSVAGTFLDIRSRVKSRRRAGLLSVAFHPQYATNHRFYVDYTDTSGDTRVVEFRSANGIGRPGTARQLLFVDQPYENHNGGQLQFDRNGYLYVGMGDGGSGGDPENRAQNLKSRLGKLLRINPTRKGVGLADRRLRAAQPVAVLLRPHERQPLDRRRRPEQLGGGRLPERGARRPARELRLEPVRGQRPYTTRTSRSSARAT